MTDSVSQINLSSLLDSGSLRNFDPSPNVGNGVPPFFFVHILNTHHGTFMGFAFDRDFAFASAPSRVGPGAKPQRYRRFSKRTHGSATQFLRRTHLHLLIYLRLTPPGCRPDPLKKEYKLCHTG